MFFSILQFIFPDDGAGEFPESGGDSVDDAVFPHDFVDHRARARDELLGLLRELK